MRILGILVLASVVAGAQSPPPPVNVPNIRVSGIGAQAFAHYVNPMGVVTDIMIILNVNGDNEAAAKSPMMTVFISQFHPATGIEMFSGVTREVSQVFGDDLASAKLSGTVETRPRGNQDLSPLRATVDLTWSARGAHENVAGSSSFNQPAKIVTQSLNGSLRRATVSGSILVGSDLITLSQTDVTMSLWNTTNAQHTSTDGQQTADNKQAQALAVTSSSCTGVWTGYWTWDGVRQQWVWTWVWWNCSGGAWIVG